MDISGIKELQNAIKGLDKKATQGLSDELSAAALNIQRDAKRNAPGNFGKLRQSIGIDIGNTLYKSTFSTASYAPYMEFGTGGKVSIPPGFENMAALYKGGKGGTFKEFLLALTLWCKRKGIDTKAAYIIALSILRNGVKPRPFMIPAYEKEKPRLLKRLKELFK